MKNDIKKAFMPVRVFAKISIKRAFRDKTSIFFTFLFPLIFLFVFGGIFGKNKDVSFRVALVNQSPSPFAQKFVDQAKTQKVFKIDDTLTSLDKAKDKMKRSQLDAAIILPADFGVKQDSQAYPSGTAQVYYTQNDQQAGQALTSILAEEFKGINTQFVNTNMPFKVEGKQTNDKALSQFDYTFAGLLGFSIIGLGIFGPINVFPELKKQGILKRLHTTPLKVWQYFTANAISQSIIGLCSMALMFAVAMAVFHLNVVGNPLELVIYLVLSIITILGIGLAIGGWASNERQAAPLANIVVFPMMFLSGTFFPRYLMPEWLQKVSAFLPLTPVIEGIRLITTEGKHLVNLGPQLGLMGLWIVVIYLIAFRVFRWE
jgi:ABC-2 type transport system permease protein